MKYYLLQNELDLCKLLSYFDDSIVRKCEITTHGYVDKNYCMYNDYGNFDLRMLLQIQDVEIPSIQIKFWNVSKFKFNEIVIPDPWCVKHNNMYYVTYNKTALSTCIQEENYQDYDWDIIAENIGYCILDNNFLGEYVNFDDKLED